MSSNYLQTQGAVSYERHSKVSKHNARIKTIEIIQDILNGFEIIHARNRWRGIHSQMSEDEWNFLFVSFNYLEKVINELKTLAPLMKDFNTDDEKKIKILKESLAVNDWNHLFFEIYETLETKGDFFAYWSTGESSKQNGIPVLRVLESENMYDIQLDPMTNEPIAYIYKEDVYEEELDETTGEVYEINSREVTWIFKKGYIRINDPVKYKENGYKIFYNKPEYSDMIRILHIPSFKKQKEKFSTIPASQYIDPSLLLAELDTLRHKINESLCWPVPWITGGYIDEENSALIAGGSISIKMDDWLYDLNKETNSVVLPKIQFSEIGNDLKPITDEKYDAVSDLYKKACLMREGLEEIVSKSDSSRNFGQLRIGIEQKNKKYYTNIAIGTEPYFKVCLNENGQYSKTDKKQNKKYTLELPDVLVNNSIFDDFLITVQKRALGLSTLVEELRKEGKTEKEIKERLRLVNEELYTKGEDMSFDKKNKIPNEVIDRVANGSNIKTDQVNNLDNNFK